MACLQFLHFIVACIELSIIIWIFFIYNERQERSKWCRVYFGWSWLVGSHVDFALSLIFPDYFFLFVHCKVLSKTARMNWKIAFRLYTQRKNEEKEHMYQLSWSKILRDNPHLGTIRKHCTFSSSAYNIHHSPLIIHLSPCFVVFQLLVIQQVNLWLIF